MIVHVSVELFEYTTFQERGALLGLIRGIIEDEHHALRLEPCDAETAICAALDHPEQADRSVSGVEWALSLGPDDRKDLKTALSDGPLVEQGVSGVAGQAIPAWQRGKRLEVRVERRKESDWKNLCLTPRDALDLLREPVHLHIEDADHDLQFVLWLAHASNRGTLQRLLNAPARIMVHGGGTGTLKRWLNGLAKKDPISPTEARRLWKSWVLFDKDAGSTDALQASDAILQLIQLAEQVVQCHQIPFTWICLQRREIESYIPDSGLPTNSHMSQQTRMFKITRNRTDRQEWAWAYDMKKGLMGDLRQISIVRRAQLKTSRHPVPQPKELKSPFDRFNNQEVRALVKGFGEDILNRALSQAAPPSWLQEMGDEYDRGPSHQISRNELIQSIFDRF